MPSSIQFSDLQTERLELRQLKDSDREKIIQLRSDPDVHKYLARPLLRKSGEAIDFIHRVNDGITKKEWYYWAISLLSEDDLIGTVCLFNFSEDQKVAEIGYELLPQYQGKGYMSEALGAVIDFAFQKLKLDLIDAYIHKENKASLKILGRLSFEADITKDQASEKYTRYFLSGEEKW